MQFTDTHCHIHEASQFSSAGNATQKLWAKAGDADPDAILERAKLDGVSRLICIGTSLEDSELAVHFVQKQSGCWASIGIHPHEARLYVGNKKALKKFSALAGKPKVVAVGECGLDYYYGHSPKKEQEQLLRFQVELALQHDLPVSFHVRDAFEDFWPILDSYKNVRGVIHSFSATMAELDQILQRGLYVGLNGIMTFTKNPDQLDAARAVPLDKLLLETDAPFLTPVPYRGTICEPKHVRDTGEFLAKLRHETLEEIAHATTRNAKHLFNIQ